LTTNDVGVAERSRAPSDRSIALGAAGLAVVFGLAVVTHRAEYLAFHSSIEFLVAAVSLALFAISWHTRRLVDDDFLTVLGVCLLFGAATLFVHALTYNGMPIFLSSTVTTASQFWIEARLTLAVGLVVAPLFIGRRLKRPGLAFVAFGVPVLAGIWAVFAGRFPVTFVADVGLTPFKIVSEWVIIALMALGWWMLFRRRNRLAPRVFVDLSVAIGCMIAAELVFTAYTSVTDDANVVGHLLHLVSFYYVYRALIAQSLEDPFTVLFRTLTQRETELRDDNRLSEGLSQIIVDVNRWMNVDDAMANAMAGAASVAGADAAVVSLYDGEGRMGVVHAHGAHLTEARGASLDRAQAPFAFEAIEIGAPVVIVDTAADARAGCIPERFGTRSMLTVPLTLRGEAAGVMTLHWRRQNDGVRSPRLILFARKLAAALSLALANAQLYEGEHRVAETLQGAMAASVETVTDVEIGSVYRSAPGIGHIGGDFFDVFDLPEGKLAFVLGDVSGKGIEAAATNALARSTIRALAYRNQDPGSVLTGASEALLQQLGDAVFVTAAFGVIDTNSLEVAISVAGHPEPMVCDRPDLVPDESRNPPLAVVSGEQYDVWRFTMRPGEILVLFSDGICEARRDGEMYGMERVRRFLSSCAGDTGQHIADKLLEDVELHSGGNLRDDVAVLTLRPRLIN